MIDVLIGSWAQFVIKMAGDGETKASANTSMDTNSKLDSILNQFVHIQTSLNELSEQKETIATIDSKLTELVDDFKTIKTDVETSQKKIEQLQSDQKDMVKRLNDLEKKFDTCKTETIDENAKSCEFLSQMYEKLKNNPEEMIALRKENTHLKNNLDVLADKLEQERIQRNVEQQYHRTALNAKLCGVPLQEGEDELKVVSNSATLKVITAVCKAAKIDFDPDSVDVCHRIGMPNTENETDGQQPERGIPPIIIRFKSKHARYHFFSQKYKLKKFSKQDAKEQRRNGVGRGERGAFKNGGKRPGGANNPEPFDLSKIFMQEHLTKMNKYLLKEARQALDGIFKYSGYVMNGQIRARLVEGGKFSVIKSVADIQALKLQHQTPKS